MSMMPDLSQDISTEQTTWEEIMRIKAMPVPMVQKREMKAKILVGLKITSYYQSESYSINKRIFILILSFECFEELQ